MRLIYSSKLTKLTSQGSWVINLNKDLSFTVDSKGAWINTAQCDLTDPEVFRVALYVGNNADMLYRACSFGKYYGQLDEVSDHRYRDRDRNYTYREILLEKCDSRELRYVIECADCLLDQRVIHFKDDVVGFRNDLYDLYRQRRDEEDKQAFETLSEKYLDPMPGYVYLFQIDGGMCKIGFSISPNERAEQVIKGPPMKVDILHVIPTNQMRCAEEFLHTMFRFERIKKTEWFNLDEDDIDEIKDYESLTFDWLEQAMEIPQPSTNGHTA